MKTIALIGRPNVGKSTLFNRLVGRRMALVHAQPGMTRDYKEATAYLYDLTFNLLDTAGLSDPSDGPLTQAMFTKTRDAIAKCDAVLFLVDSQTGCTPYDFEIASILRQCQRPIIVIANKSEGSRMATGVAEAAQLGVGEAIVSLSAEHGTGLRELYDALSPYLEEKQEECYSDGMEAAESYAEEEASQVEPHKPLQLAVVGRPNVGKSTLINRLIGEERLLTANIPGVTRDAITVDWHYKGHPISLVDTAGLRRRSKVDTAPEKLSVLDTRRTIQFSEVVILVLDAEGAFEKQDLTLAQQIVAEGRAVLIAINKWDLVQDKTQYLKNVQHILDTQLSQVKGIPCIPISALEGRGLGQLLEAALKLYAQWNRRLSTSQLNKWLEQATGAHPAPVVKGRRIRLKYLTQVKSRPPTFAVFVSQAEQLPESYTRYLVNKLREEFQFWGIPIRMHIRSSDNPYGKRS